MDDGGECRLLVGELITKCMDVGLSRREVMQIVTGEPGEVSTLLANVSASDAIERRVRYLLEIISIAKSICGAETGPWSAISTRDDDQLYRCSAWNDAFDASLRRRRRQPALSS